MYKYQIPIQQTFVEFEANAILHCCTYTVKAIWSYVYGGSYSENSHVYIIFSSLTLNNYKFLRGYDCFTTYKHFKSTCYVSI